MKLNLVKLGLAALVATFAAQVQAGPVFVQLDTNSGDAEFNAPYTEVYVNQTFKINDRYAITPELVHNLNYKKDGKSNFNLTHELIRLSVSDKGVAKLGEWKVGTTYQYIVPSVRELQLQGMIGILNIRPQISRSWGSFELLVRNRLGFYLQRRAYRFDDATKGNTLYDNLLEVAPGYDFGNGIAAGIYLADRHSYVGGGTGGGDGQWRHRFYSEVEVGYTAESLGKTYFGLVYLTDTRYGFGGNKFKLFQDAGTSYSFKISRSFDM